MRLNLEKSGIINRTILVNLTAIGSGPERYPLFVHAIIMHSPLHSIVHDNYLSLKKDLRHGQISLLQVLDFFQ